MVEIPGSQTVLQVLRIISGSGSTWRNRYVTLRFHGASQGWILVYPLSGNTTPYFDFMYGADHPPEEVFSGLLKAHPGSLILDWSPGRSACMEVPVADVETLAEVMLAIAKEAWGESNPQVEAFYEEMGKA